MKPSRPKIKFLPLFDWMKYKTHVYHECIDSCQQITDTSELFTDRVGLYLLNNSYCYFVLSDGRVFEFDKSQFNRELFKLTVSEMTQDKIKELISICKTKEALDCHFNLLEAYDMFCSLRNVKRNVSLLVRINEKQGFYESN